MGSRGMRNKQEARVGGIRVANTLNAWNIRTTCSAHEIGGSGECSDWGQMLGVLSRCFFVLSELLGRQQLQLRNHISLLVSACLFVFTLYCSNNGLYLWNPYIILHLKMKVTLTKADRGMPLNSTANIMLYIQSVNLMIILFLIVILD